MFCRLLLLFSFLVGLKANAAVASDHAGEMTRGLDLFERDVVVQTGIKARAWTGEVCPHATVHHSSFCTR